VRRAEPQGRQRQSLRLELHRQPGEAGPGGKATGAYDLKFESGKPYAGKGPEARMRGSIRRIEKQYNDKLVSKDYYSCANDRETFMKEDELIEKNGGPRSEGNKDTYNLINSPGKKLRGRKP